MADSISGSVKQVDDDSWLIGKRFVLRRTPFAERPLWKDGNDLYYSLSDAVSPLPPATALPADSYPCLVHDCANISAVWAFDDVVLKIKLFQARKGGTRENVTLDWVAKQKLDLDIPRVLHYSEDEDRTYLFSTRLSGTTLNAAWPSMNEDHKQYYAQRIVDICTQLSVHKSTKIGGVDGSQLPDTWMQPFTKDFRSETLIANCIQLGMQISPSTAFFFSHNDLAPGNIIINLQEKRYIGIIDWELAGFVPWEWICTKFAVGWGLDLEQGGVARSSDADWRKQVHRELKRRGFPDVADSWKAWFNELYALRN